MSTTTSTDGVGVARTGDGAGFGRLVDWIVTGLLVLWGIGLAAGGLVLFDLADRTVIARWIAEGRLTSTELTDLQLLDATYAAIWWGGIGLVVTGLLFLVAAVGFLALRSRARRSDPTTDSLATSAVLGAVVTAVTSFVPFSALIGGAAAGYDRGGSRETGLRTGAISGLLGAVPIGVVFAFLAVGLLSVDATAGGVAIAALVLSLVTVATTFLVLGAIGGYVGAGIGRRDSDPDADSETATA